jgi:hypothetical protein
LGNRPRKKRAEDLDGARSPPMVWAAKADAAYAPFAEVGLTRPDTAQ